MSDIMRPMRFDHLMNWILGEYEAQKTIFGERAFAKTTGAARPIFREKIETPFGPAAGPNTQLAQNIVASYVTGARFFELKTVQKMDGEELSACVNKPCILASDEGYNCEWSTELTVPQAFDEYVKALSQHAEWVGQHRVVNLLDAVRGIVPCLMNEVRIAANRVHLNTHLLQLFVLLCQVNQLGGANEGKVCWIEEENGPFAFYVFARYGFELAILISLHLKFGQQ